MVLETVKEKAFDYLKSKGLTKEDIGRVIGIFFFAKYITFASMIPICYRYQPLRRFIKPVTTRDYFIARRNRFHQSRIGQQAKSYQDWLKRNNVDKRVEKNVVEMRRKLNVFMNEKKMQFNDRKIRLTEMARERAAASAASHAAINGQSSWKMRLYTWTEKVAEKAAKNERWKNIAKGLQVPPKQLAYAIGEGLVFYKITSPIWMPIELYGIVKVLQWRNAARQPQ